MVMSVEAARRLGVPEEKWVYLHGHSDLIEQPLLDRVDLGAGPASVLAAEEGLRVAGGVGVDDIATFDLYSCFPFPVFVICETLGLSGDDPPAASRSPADCPTSVGPETAIRCTGSPRPSARCATRQGGSASSAPTAGS